MFEKFSSNRSQTLISSLSRLQSICILAILLSVIVQYQTWKSCSNNNNKSITILREQATSALVFVRVLSWFPSHHHLDLFCHRNIYIDVASKVSHNIRSESPPQTLLGFTGWAPVTMLMLFFTTYGYILSKANNVHMHFSFQLSWLSLEIFFDIVFKYT